MGNINSIPVVSQIKSLVQVISGDETGAKKTQEEFARKGIIVSQFNSMAHAIMGNKDEARKIQHEFVGDMEVFADNVPVVGHIKSGVHMALGDEEKAKEVAMSATKSTVVALSAVAGAACGPGAAACGAALAVSANAAWDGADSAIAGENRGIVKAVNDIANGDANVEETFDTIAGQTMLAAGGALTAKAAVPSSGAKAATFAGKAICKRSTPFNNELFDNHFPLIQGSDKLPKSLTDINLNTELLAQPENLVATLYTVFTILKLISVGHPSSKPYYDEICGGLFVNEELKDCESKLFEAFSKFGNIRDGEASFATSPLEDSFESLIFQMNHLIRNTTIGFNLKIAICNNYLDENHSGQCFSLLEKALSKLKRAFNALDDTRIRRKRATGCVPKILVGGITKSSKASQRFVSNHILPDDVFVKGVHSLDDVQVKNVDFLNENINFRKDVSKNTLIRASDLDNLNLAETIETGKSIRGNPIYRSPDVVDLITVDHIQPGAGAQVSVGRGTFSFTRGVDGELMHLHDTQFVQPPNVKILPPSQMD